MITKERLTEIRTDSEIQVNASGPEGYTVCDLQCIRPDQ